MNVLLAWYDIYKTDPFFAIIMLVLLICMLICIIMLYICDYNLKYKINRDYRRDIFKIEEKYHEKTCELIDSFKFIETLESFEKDLKEEGKF